MSNVFQLVETVIDEDKQSAIETLERLLQEAKDGQIRGVAVAVVRPDYAMNTTWSESNAVAPLLGAIQLLNKRMLAELDEPNEG